MVNVINARTGLKIAGEGAVGHDLTEVNNESAFARSIRELFRTARPRKIIETGTYHGEGTTRVIASALKELDLTDAQFWSIECNPDHYRRAAANLAGNGLSPFVRLRHGLSLPRALLPTREEIRDRLVDNVEFDDIYVDHQEHDRALLYFRETDFAGTPDDLLGACLKECDYRPDFVLLDSGGHLGNLEFNYLVERLRGECLIALDDIQHVKHHRSFRQILDDPRFELLGSGDEKFGFCIARFSPRREEAGERIGNILWVRPDSIGDAILASAMLPHLREHYRDARITVVCQEHVAELYEACPHVDAILTFDRNRALADGAYRTELIGRLRAVNADLSLNPVFSREPLTDLLAIECGARERIAFAGNLSNMPAEVRERHNALYTRLIASAEEQQGELERHRDFLAGLGIRAELEPTVWITPADDRFAADFFRDNGLDPARTIALFAGAQCAVRIYGGYGEALAPVCRENSFPVLALGSGPDFAASQHHLDRIGGRTFNLCGRTTLRQAAALLSRCRLAVGAETGLAHMACAVGTPNVVLLGGGHFGRFIPYSPLTTVACLPLACYGCDWRCHYQRAHCVAGLLPAVFGEAVGKALAGATDTMRVVTQGSSLWQPAPGEPAWQHCGNLLPANRLEIVPAEGTAPLAAAAGATESAGRRRVFPESALAHRWLDGLAGLEIGPSAHNPFGLNTRNVGLRDEIYEQEQLKSAGVSAPLHLVARADAIPVPDESEDFVLSSHVIEHCPNLIKTLVEWYRIVRKGGYLFMIVPHPDAAPSDRGRPLTDWRHVLDDYTRGATELTEPEAGRFGHCHYHVFDFSGMQQLVARIFGERLALVDARETDDKIGNGFILVYKKSRSLAESLPWDFAPPAPAAEEIAALNGTGEDTGRGDSSRAGETPLVSAIVSTYAAEAFIRGCLEDLTEQTLYQKGELEIVVIDSASPQDEGSIVREFLAGHPRISYLRTGERETIYQAWNRGIKAARGKYLTNANTDDRHRGDALEVMARELERHPEAALVYADVLVTNAANQHFASHIRCGYQRRPAFSREIMLSGCHMGPQPMWRRSLHDELGYFHEALQSAGDYEFWCRIALRHPMRHVAEFLGLYHDNPAGICNRDRELSSRETAMVQQAYRDKLPPPKQNHTNNCHYAGPDTGGRFVNICMITFNRLEFTRQAIDALLSCTDYPYALTVVDNGSSDGTPAYLTGLRERGIVKNLVLLEENVGVARASNLAWSLEPAAACYLKLDNDIVIRKPGWLTAMVDVIDAIPELGAVAYNFEPASYPVRMVNGRPIRPKEFANLGGACILIPKQTERQLGYWCEEYGLYSEEDFDYGCRIRLAGLHNAYMADEEVGVHLPAGRAAQIDMQTLAAADGVEEHSQAEYRRWKDEQRRKNLGPNGRLTMNLQEYQAGTRPLYAASPFVTGRAAPVAGNAGRHADGASIVIVTYNSARSITGCLASVARSLRPHDEVIIVDNASRDETVRLAEQFIAGDSRFSLIASPTNKGFSAGTNTGIGASANPYVVLLNPDTIVTPHWLDRLIAHFGDAGTAAVGPLSNHVAGLQQMQLYQKGEFAAGIRPDEAAEQFYRWNRGKAVHSKLLIGFCLMIRREIIDRLGALDEQLFLGNDDLELSWRLRANELTLKIATDTFIYHEGQQSFRTESAETTARLIRESSDALYAKLKRHYGEDNVPTPEELWGIGWFAPCSARFNPDAHLEDLVLVPGPPAEPQAATGGAASALVSIIILTMNQLSYSEECVASIRKHTPENHEIIFVDNGSRDGTVPWLRRLAGEDGRCRLIENSENLGFARGCNQGIQAASGDFILLLNNDVVVTEGWLAGLLECFAGTATAGVVGPMSDNVGGRQQVGELPFKTMAEMELFAGEFRARNRFRRIPARSLAGFCMLFRRELADRIGLLDESFGSGNFEDDDYCLRAALAGYGNLIAGDVFVHHYGSRTFTGNNIDYRSALAENRRIFNLKWDFANIEESLARQIVVIRAMEKAAELNDREETDQAVAVLLEHGIGSAPADPRPYYALAEGLIGAGRFRDALDTLKELPGMDRDVRKHALTGYCREGLGHYREAGEAADRALALRPDHAPALNLKGVLAFHGGDRQLAEEFFARAMAADPGYGEPCTNLGVVAWGAGRKEEALRLLERGAILSPAAPGVLTAFHAAIAETGDFARAERTLREARTLYPQHKRLAFLLIDTLLRQDKQVAAMREIEQAALAFGFDDGMLAAALEVRRRIGPPEADSSARAGGSVSLCMIVRDEETYLPRCLASLKPLVDEMIVVDTGSTDRTRSIATVFGAKVFDCPWNDDFAAARNFSLAKASGDWVLAMDADEVISPLDHATFRELVEKPGAGAAACRFVTRNYLADGSVAEWHANDGRYAVEEAGAGWVPSGKVRLFPRTEGVCWTGPVHETVEPSLAGLNIPVRDASLPIHHYGKLDAGREAVKLASYYELGKKKLAGQADDPAAIRELAIQASGLGKYQEAVELWQRFITIAPNTPPAYFNLGYAYLQLNRFAEAREATGKALELKPDLDGAAVNFAMCEICLGDVGKAITGLENSLEKRPDSPSALAMLGAAYCCAGRKEEGLEIFSTLKGRRIRFDDFLHDTVAKLLAAEKADYARPIVEAAVASDVASEKITGLIAACG